MRLVRTLLHVFTLAVVLLVPAVRLCADPPSRVGRLNLVDGPVSFRPGSLDEWSAATINYPLTTGDGLWTSAGGEAEVHVGSTAIRLRSNTDITFLNLDDQTIQIQLPGGAVDIRLRHLPKHGVVEVATPNASVVLMAVGSYRVDVRHNGNVRVTVRQGQAEMTVANQSFTLTSGQAAMVPQTDPQGFWVQAAMAPDAWDAWCEQRDAQEDNIASTQYVPADLVGVEDLDQYGTWTATSDYGPVWQPSGVAADWAPYSNGRWAWVEPWGWTWIDNAPWGFAPFHYGRWTHLGNGWGWVPGKAVQKTRPVYAPALVVFVGGNEPSASWSGNGIGWFPLGPREAYVPPYKASGTYLRDMNAFAGAKVDNSGVYRPQDRYVNREIPGAVRGLQDQSFGRALTTPGFTYPVSPKEVVRAPVMGTTARVVPQKESVVAYSNPSGTAAERPAEGLEQKPVVARMAPPPAPVPFTARQEALKTNQGRPLDQGTVKSIAKTVPVTRPAAINVVSGQNVKSVKPTLQSNDKWWKEQSGP
jgi:hypothetical protein